MKGLSLRVAARVAATEAEGPHLRYALWVQGCPLRCDGCCNPGMLAPSGGDVVPVEVLAAEIEATPRIEGVTLLGGEPFAQAPALAALAARVRARGLGVMVFTGYALEALRASPEPGVAALLAETDLLVDGPYERARASSARRFIGSDNQRVHAFGARYAALAVPGGWAAGAGEVEVRIDGARVFLNGAPDPALAAALGALAQP
ncbi:MAG: 4Fe-4S single cluster domain-containing protein [Anaeromyxobacteraceae bacterium]